MSVASGDMIGIVTNAWPLPDGIKKLQIVCTTSMPSADTSAPKFLSRFARALMMVSMTRPSESTTSIVRANPTIKAAAVISAAPLMNVRLVSPAGIRAINAVIRPIPRNTAFSSPIYQPYFATPATNPTMPVTNTSSTAIRGPVRRTSAGGSKPEL